MKIHWGSFAIGAVVALAFSAWNVAGNLQAGTISLN